MKYHVIVFDRNSGIWDEMKRQDLSAQNLRDAKKEAEAISDRYNDQNVSVVLYNENRKRIAKFSMFKYTFL